MKTLQPRSWRRLVARGTTRAGDQIEPSSRALDRRFFDDRPRFYASSETSPQPWRLNLRHEAIFGEYADIFPGARVLDIASHDGRWTLASLEAGATHVIGIEARPDLVEMATRNLQHYAVDPAWFRFVQGSVFDVLADSAPEVDVVLCLGFVYHTLRYNELWKRIEECGARHVVIDTLVHPGEDAVVRLVTEPVGRQGNAAADDLSHDGRMLIGRPTLSALHVMAEGYGFEPTGRTDWSALLRDNPGADGVGDYRAGRRVTVCFTRRR